MSDLSALNRPMQSIESRAARTGRLSNAARNLTLGAMALGGIVAVQGINSRITNAINNTHEQVSAATDNTAVAANRPVVVKFKKGSHGPTLDIK